MTSTNSKGLVVFMNNGGLGNQTRRLVDLIKPDKLLVIDSSSFSTNKDQNRDWYEGFNKAVVEGFPTDEQVRNFLKGLTHVLLAETALNNNFYAIAKELGVKVFLQNNYEFTDHLIKDMELPYKFILPSHWKLEEMNAKFPNVQYLPPPIDPGEFAKSREINKVKSNRLLHTVGTLAAKDRNGTLDVLRALKYVNKNFKLVVKSQHKLPSFYYIRDSRVEYRIGNQLMEDIYSGYDGLVLPRRYGGLSLPCNEALMSGLPVVMTNISPNDSLLPKEWLVSSVLSETLMARTQIGVYQSNIHDLAIKMEYLLDNDLHDQAYEIGYNNFSYSVLRDQYAELWSL